MPTNASKRKAKAVVPTDAASSTRLHSNKRSMTIKSAEGMQSMKAFLDEVCAHQQGRATENCATVAAIRQSPMLMKALLRCHERFVRIVASELASPSTSAQADTKDASTSVQRVGEKNVMNALKELGMSDIIVEMKQMQQSVRSAASTTEGTAKKRRKNERRIKQWTEEEIVEQEQLLASSKEKFLRGGG